MDEELKPCRYCGGKAKLVTEKYSGKEFYGIRCCGCHLLQTMTEDKDKAIIDWNRGTGKNMKVILELKITEKL